MILPSNYTRLGYIESSGNQYIDTEFKPNQNTRVVITLAMIPQDNTTDYPPFGARIASGNADYSLWNIDSSNTVQSHYGSTKIKGTVEDITTKTKYDKDKNKLYVNDQLLITNTAETFQPGYNMFLFACNNAGTVSAKSYMRLYSCQIYDNGTLVRDFVPCRMSYSNAGLYDLVNGQYYPNAGSGRFTEGEYVPEATGEYQFIYLPASKVYACGRTIANDPSSTGEYPDVFGSFKASTGLTQDGGTFSLASPTYTFTLDTYELHGSELPSAGSYIEVNGVIYQVTSDSRVTTEYSSTGGWTSTLYTSTGIYITNLKQVILGTPNTGSDHSALIDSTQRNIDGGFCLVNGTGYEIVKGIALIDGTGRDITFGPSLYLEVETWNQAEGYSSNQGKATITHTESDDVLTGVVSYSKGWYSVPSDGVYAGINWHVFDEETDDFYELQVNDIVEWEMEGTVDGGKYTESRLLFFTNPSDTWVSIVKEFSSSGSYLVTRACYMQFDCHVACSNANSEASLSIRKLTVNGKDVWIK